MKKKSGFRCDSGVLTAKDMEKLRKLMPDMDKLTSEEKGFPPPVNVTIKGIASDQPGRAE